MASKHRKWQGAFLIPKAIRLPGLTIKVKMGTPEELMSMGKPDGAWLYDLEDEMAVILLDASIPIEVQRYTLLHELQHAVIELVDIMLENYPQDVRTRSMLPATGEIIGGLQA